MAVRNVVTIDEEKCNGCGLCVNACAEGAIQIVDGKARLISETYCDGLGACLGHCPQDAITVEQREAAEFDEEATKAHLARQAKPAAPGFACPGLAAHNLSDRKQPADDVEAGAAPSQLRHWPVQLKLVSPTAAYFAGADLLLVADCVPFAMGDFHRRILRGHSVAVGCPKLDDVGFYVDKLADILRHNTIRRLTVVHMEVPCCAGLTHIAREAIARSGKTMAFEDTTISLRGDVIRSQAVESETAGRA